MGQGAFKMELKQTGLAGLLGNYNLLPKCSPEMGKMISESAYSTSPLLYNDAKKLLAESARIIHFEGELVVEDFFWENGGVWHPLMSDQLSPEVGRFIKNKTRLVMV